MTESKCSLTTASVLHSGPGLLQAITSRLSDLGGEGCAGMQDSCAYTFLFFLFLKEVILELQKISTTEIFYVLFIQIPYLLNYHVYFVFAFFMPMAIIIGIVSVICFSAHLWLCKGGLLLFYCFGVGYSFLFVLVNFFLSTHFAEGVYHL